MQDDTQAKRISGRVKWFDPVKGFGFISSDSGEPDILLHVNVLRNFGQSSVADGSEVIVEVQTTERGNQAVEIHSIVPPSPTEPIQGYLDLALADDIDEVKLQTLPWRPARVKWFDRSKGFGFATLFGESQDVFLHLEVLRKSGMADLIAGEAIGVRVVQGQRGTMAVQLADWDNLQVEAVPVTMLEGTLPEGIAQDLSETVLSLKALNRSMNSTHQEFEDRAARRRARLEQL